MPIIIGIKGVAYLCVFLGGWVCGTEEYAIIASLD